MAITYGPFPYEVNTGYVHFDTVSSGLFRYLGGNPSSVDNWKLVGGELSENPDTTGWGDRQRGATWFNVAEGNFFGWNGSAIVYLG